MIHALIVFVIRASNYHVQMVSLVIVYITKSFYIIMFPVTIISEVLFQKGGNNNEDNENDIDDIDTVPF